MATYIYDQRTGELSPAPGGKLIATGYSGYGEGKNNPALQYLPDVGPIPRGMYLMGMARTDAELGPVAIPLGACNGTETFGRCGFFMHGDDIRHPGCGSHGCVIMPRIVREMMRPGDRLLVVASVENPLPVGAQREAA